MMVPGAVGTCQHAMSAERLSALDASFLAIERPEAPMHVGWVALFDPPVGPRPGYAELFEHIAARLGRAPRYRQKLAGVPFGLHDPVWVDDPSFDVAEHLPEARGGTLDDLVDGALSTPLERDRPLWQMAIATALPGDDRIALIGKMHHCMVDGAAVVELGNLLLDADPDEWTSAAHEPHANAAPGPSASELVARAARERAGDAAALALAPARLATSPRRIAGFPGAARRSARTF